MKPGVVACLLSMLGTTAWSQPQIFSFDPLTGPAGTTVTILGSGFNASSQENVVFFGASRAAVLAGNLASLSVSVPAGTTFQNLSITNLATGLTGYSLRPFITTYACGEPVDSTSFGNRQDYPAGSSPGNIALSDLDNDTRPDIVVSNVNSNAVSVFRNIGSPGDILFEEKVDLPSGYAPEDVATADFNGDGTPDIVTANYYSHSISVMINHSSPGILSFEAALDFPAGFELTNITTADLDGDGRPDVIATNAGLITNTIVFRNISAAGTISFEPGINLVTGKYPSNVSAGDLDGDGKPDLAVTSNNSGFVSLLRNTSVPGVISFEPKKDFTTTYYPTGSFIGEVDGDGKADLAIANGNVPSVSVFRNTSTPGLITFESPVDFPTGTYPTGFSMGDVDGDGRPDITVADHSDDNVTILINGSAPGMVSFQPGVAITTGNGPLNALQADFDGDGRPDLVTVNMESNDISVFRNLQCDVLNDIREKQEGLQMDVYPNPAESHTVIAFSRPVSGIVSIYSMMGQAIYQRTIGSTTTLSLDFSLVPAGLYQVQVISGDWVVNRKIIVR